ncbi:MAG: hypothetical protein JW779_14505 [Candidatus Thorarchaeota archaeon]|nr:hypothetical protein [Candidatus Thorarchaeota archaeon]
MPEEKIVKSPIEPRDRDIFRDHQHRLFVVLGYIQPTDRVLSYLKYVPDEDGMWKTADTHYRRVFWGSVDSTVEGMTILPEDYIILDTHFNTNLVEPPCEAVEKFYCPEERLQEILNDSQDALEELTKKAAELLHDRLGIPMKNLGVAGSILWRGHSPTRSDINMNIYGYQASRDLFENLANLEGVPGLARLRELPEWGNTIKRVRERIPVLQSVDLNTLFSRRRALCLENRCIGITPVLYNQEAPIHHGSESYTTLKSDPVKCRLTIENADYGIFHPAIYGTSPVIYDGLTIDRILVFDGAFGGLFVEGDSVEVSGTLQKVLVSEDQREFYQIMVGTKAGSGKEYIRFL